MSGGRQSGATFQTKPGFRVIDGGLSRMAASSPVFQVIQHTSAWVEQLTSRLNSLTSLERGWDGYDGQPVSYSCASFAANLLETLCVESVPAPSLVPGNDGTVQVEWHLGGYDIELHVLGANDVAATRYSIATDQEETEQLENDFAILVEWIDGLNRVHTQEARARA